MVMDMEKGTFDVQIAYETQRRMLENMVDVQCSGIRRMQTHPEQFEDRKGAEKGAVREPNGDHMGPESVLEWVPNTETLNSKTEARFWTEMGPESPPPDRSGSSDRAPRSARWNASASLSQRQLVSVQSRVTKVI